jgi:hypothetical protein
MDQFGAEDGVLVEVLSTFPHRYCFPSHGCQCFSFQVSCRYSFHIDIFFFSKELMKMKGKLCILWGPVALGMWLVSSATICVLFEDRFSLLEALALGACVTPTDPILASSIVKGLFAEEHIPASVRDLLSAER